MAIDYHGRSFRAVANSVNGETSSETVFHYRQRGSLLTATYHGGRIVAGHLLGLVADDGSLDFRYHQINDRYELMTGVCRSTPEVLPDGRIRLHETWSWTSGDHSSGTSIVEEIGEAPGSDENESVQGRVSCPPGRPQATDDGAHIGEIPLDT